MGDLASRAEKGSGKEGGSAWFGVGPDWADEWWVVVEGVRGRLRRLSRDLVEWVVWSHAERVCWELAA